MRLKMGFLMVILCLLAGQAALAQQNVYRSWVTDAAATEFSNCGYNAGTSQFTAPTVAPSTGLLYGTRSSGMDLTSYAPSSAANAQFVVGAMGNANDSGCISFWIRPNENGKLISGGAEHYLLEAGNPDTNGFRISWDNAKGTLRFRMSNETGKTTVCRADISSWQATEWHHVQVNWYARTNCARGLAIFIDRVCTASCIMGADSFMSVPAGNKVKLGGLYGTSSTDPKCYMDELIFRTGVSDNGQLLSASPVCYRDFFLTAPYTSIVITENPHGESDPYSTASPRGVMSVASDNWVLKSTTGVNAKTMKKQYSILATRKLTSSISPTMYEYITSYEHSPVGYGSWGEFDAKPNVAWSITSQGTGGSNTTVTTGAAWTLNGGLVTGGTVPVTDANLRAVFRGMTANKTLVIREWENKPDLGIQYIERLPRYHRDNTQKWPNPGDTVTTEVYFGNFGTTTITANFSIKYEWATDTNNNFRIDGSENWTTITPVTHTYTPDIAAGTHDLNDSVTWNWPTGDPLGVNSVFVRVTLDSTNILNNEICEANNQRTEKSNAKAYQWGYHHIDPELDDIGNRIFPDRVYFHEDYNNRVVNLIGSFSDYDWYNAHVDRTNIMLRTTKGDTVNSLGIQEGLRVDLFTAWAGVPADEYEDMLPFVDGGFPEVEHNGGCTQLEINCVTIHEMGHTALWQVDAYGSAMPAANVLLGSGVGGSNYFPVVTSWGNPSTNPAGQMGMWSALPTGNADAFFAGYSSLMDSNHYWLSRFEAGWTHWARQYRPRVQPDFLSIMPSGSSNNRIQFYAVDDTPLLYARVWVYQAIDGPHDLYVPNAPKFEGATSYSTGIFKIPVNTASSWDDWNSDTVEKNTDVFNNPFDRDLGVGWPDCGRAEHLLIKVVGKDPRNTSFDKTEYHLITATELANQFFKNSLSGCMLNGNGSPDTPGTLVIRTSLANVYGPGAQSPPAQTLNTNYAPTARVRYNGVTYTNNFTINVPAYTNFILDGTLSTDPESQPLYYFWNEMRWGDPSCRNNTWTLSQPPDPDGEPTKYLFYVIDGIRTSREIIITVYTN